MGPRLALSIMGLVLGLDGMPLATAPATPLEAVDARADVGPSFMQRWAAQLHHERSRQESVEAAVARVETGVRSAHEYLALPRDPAAVDAAIRAIAVGHSARGLFLVEAALEVEQPPDVMRRARDAAAFAAHELGRWPSVLRHLDPALDGASEGPLAGYRALWLARAELEAGDAARAAAAAIAARDFDPRSPIVHAARFLHARAELRVPGREQSAVAEMERLLARYPEYPRADLAQIEMARAERRAGDDEAAARRLQALLWDRPFSGRAPEASALLAELVSQGVPTTARTWQERAEHGRSLRLRRHWDDAEDELLAALDQAGREQARTPDLNGIRFELALNAYDSARFDTALQRMQEIEASDGLGVSSYNRYTWRARSLSRLGREDEAYAVLLDYYQLRSGSERHHRMFEFASDLGMWDRAREHLAAMYSRERDWQSWDGAFTTYMAGDHARAAELFGAVARRNRGVTAHRFRYWQARALEKTGEVERALELYDSIVAEDPYKYYGLQARNRALEWRSAPPQEGSGEPRAAASLPGRLHWVGPGDGRPAGWRALGVDDADAFFAGYPAELSDDSEVAALAGDWGSHFPVLARVAALYAVGAVEDARREFRGPLIEFRALDALARQGRSFSSTRPVRLSHRPWAHFIDNRAEERGWWGIELRGERFPVPGSSAGRVELARRQTEIARARDELRPRFRAAARALGDFYMVRRFALADNLPPLEAEPMDLRWHEAYPRAYGRELRAHAERYDLNPYVVWALMIVESDMNPDTISRADAYGLLQVIPKTGDLVASGFGETDFGIHDLLEPAGSLRYGTWYLNELLTKFRGQEMLAMVAYNAGPHQVARWLQWRGSGMAMDEFIETVPYDGARRYPQRILQYISILRGVNGLSREVYVGNELDADFEDNIYY